MLIEWSKSLSIGVDLIDQDHESLVGIINRLDDAVKRVHGKEIIGDILSELSDYVGYHFDHEEQFMRRYHYPGSDEHVHQHVHQHAVARTIDCQSHDPDSQHRGHGPDAKRSLPHHSQAHTDPAKRLPSPRRFHHL